MLQRDLLRWYARSKRDLPWRKTRDPYRIWISEAMLQQTRVETVLPYYRRFLARFPDVRALAAAEEEQVLAAWSGLGYYRRARSLRASARAVVERHGGSFPGEREALLELPGVGPYTAGAIASIAFGRREALVDGNVARVLSRLFALRGDPASAAGRGKLWSLARELVPARNPGDWNQALMELGALVCLPDEPACGRCPVADDCAALREGRAGSLPKRRRREPAIPIETVVLAARRGGRWLLERRDGAGLMAGMWQMPTVEVSAGRAPRLFAARPPRGLLAKEVVCEIRHTITCHRIRATVKRAEFAPAQARLPLAWVDAGALANSALTGMTRKCLSAILASRSSPSRRKTARI